MERILQQGLETWGLPTDAIPRLQEFSRYAPAAAGAGL